MFSAVWAAGAVADEQATRSFETVSSPSGFALEDLDGDGHLDLAVGSAAEGILRVHFGDGRGGFAKHVQLEVSEDRVDAVSVSSDEDGPCVLLLADRREAVLVRVERYATGHPLARAIARQRLGRQIVRLVSGDLDGDEIPDLVFAQRGKGLSWARGKGGGHFATPRSLSLTRKALGDDLVVALTLFDADRDGLLDVIALANRTRLPEVGTAWCWSNSGKGKLRPARRWEGGTFLAHAVGDTDGDGVP